jgi:hypothetical protein
MMCILVFIHHKLAAAFSPPPLSSDFFFFFETGSHYAAHAGLKPTILLLQPPACWDYRRAPLLPTYNLFFMEKDDLFFCCGVRCIFGDENTGPLPCSDRDSGFQFVECIFDSTM